MEMTTNGGPRPPEPQTPAIDWDAIIEKHKAWDAAAAELVSENRARIYAFLASAPITRVIVTFDGEGDSGQIEDVQAYNGDEQKDLPGGSIQILDLPFGQAQPLPREMTVAEALENLAYDLLRQKHEGWENSDGAYGEFTFDVTAGTITLDYNERFMSSEFYQHSW